MPRKSKKTRKPGRPAVARADGQRRTVSPRQAEFRQPPRSVSRHEARPRKFPGRLGGR